MSILRNLRGNPNSAIPCFGQTLTIYRQGGRLGLFFGISMIVLFNLPWALIPYVGQALQLLIVAGMAYLAANVTASRAPTNMKAPDAAARWL